MEQTGLRLNEKDWLPKEHLYITGHIFPISSEFVVYWIHNKVRSLLTFLPQQPAQCLPALWTLAIRREASSSISEKFLCILHLRCWVSLGIGFCHLALEDNQEQRNSTYFLNNNKNKQITKQNNTSLRDSWSIIYMDVSHTWHWNFSLKIWLPSTTSCIHAEYSQWSSLF